MLRLRSLCACAFFCLAAAPATVLARPFGFDDYARIVGIGDPQISPDGTRIATVVARIDAAKDVRHRQLVLIDVASGKEQVILDGHDDVGSPRWSPDGTQLAYVDVAGAKDETPQVWVLTPGRSDAHVMTHAKNGVELFSWRPDGKAVAYAASDDAVNSKDIARHDDLFAVGDDAFSVRSAPVPSHLWLQEFASAQPVRLTEGTWSIYPDALSWSADAKYIAFDRVPDPHHDSFLHSRVALVDTAAKGVELVDGDRWSWTPAFAPSGDTLAYAAGAHHSRLIQQELITTSPGSQTVESVAPAFDRNVSFFTWLSADGRFAVAADDRVSTGLWLVSNRAADRVNLGDVNFGSGTSASNGAMAFTGGTSRDPEELYYLAPGAATVQQLTHYNEQIAALDLAKVEEFSWHHDGFVEYGVLTYPLNYERGKKYPLVLAIHGGPTFGASTTSFNALAQILASRGYFVLEPNYRGSDNAGFRYANAIVGSSPPLGAGSDVVAGVKALEKTGMIDSSRIGISGWSAGGWLTSWLITHYDMWKAAVTGAAIDDAVLQYSMSEVNEYMPTLFGGLTPWKGNGMAAYRNSSPITYAKNVKAATLILSDTTDPRVPTPQAYEFYVALRDLGKTVQFVAIPAVGHHPSDPIRQMAVDRVWADWFTKYMP